MSESSEYYVVRQKSVPEVLLKVVEAKRLIDTGKADTIQVAVDRVGISRSSFYKYKDDIFPFHENVKGKTITCILQMNDEPGLLADVLRIVADRKANIMTIHQSIPINGMAMTTISINVLPDTGDISEMLVGIENLQGVQSLKVTGGE